jgi:hypothetical protein
MEPAETLGQRYTRAPMPEDNGELTELLRLQGDLSS